MNKIEIIITDDANKIKQTSIRESEGEEMLITDVLATIEDVLRGCGFHIKGHLIISEEV